MLCGGNLDLPLRLTICDYEKSGKHVNMGEVETSVNGLLRAKSTSGLKIRNKGKESGTIAVLVASVTGVESIEEKMEALAVTERNEVNESQSPVPSAPIAPIPAAMSPVPTPLAPQPSAVFAPVPFAPPPPPPPTFLDYINGGCEMQLCIAIDFTGSNGDPRKPGTLHYLSPDGRSMNDYERAISAIGGILSDYDTDKKFPVWGESSFSTDCKLIAMDHFLTIISTFCFISKVLVLNTVAKYIIFSNVDQQLKLMESKVSSMHITKHSDRVWS